ncbi:MAG: transporter [Desulfobaccales bacterium]
MTWIFLTIVLGIWTAAMPGVWIAAAAETAPEHPSTAGPIIADSAVPAPPGQLNIQPYLSLGVVAGNFSTNWRRVSAGGNFYSLEMPVKFTYGLAPNIEVYLTSVMFQNWAGQVSAPGSGGSQSASFAGFGDLYGTVKYQLWEETDWRPTVTPLLSVNFPTGHHFNLNPARLGTDALGGGMFVFTPGVNLAKWVGPIYLYANLWYSFPTTDAGAPANQQASPLLPSVPGRDLITVNLAAEWPLTAHWVALLECYTSWNVGPLFRYSREVITHDVGVLPGIEYIFNSRWSCELGVAIDLVGKNSFYSYTPIFTAIMTF